MQRNDYQIIPTEVPNELNTMILRKWHQVHTSLLYLAVDCHHYRWILILYMWSFWYELSPLISMFLWFIGNFNLITKIFSDGLSYEAVRRWKWCVNTWPVITWDLGQVAAGRFDQDYSAEKSLIADNSKDIGVEWIWKKYWCLKMLTQWK